MTAKVLYPWSMGLLIVSVLFNRAYSAFTDAPSWEYRLCFSLASCAAWIALATIAEIRKKGLFTWISGMLLFAAFLLQMAVISFAGQLDGVPYGADAVVVTSAIFAGAGFAIYYCLWAAAFERMMPSKALVGISSSIGLSAIFSTLPLLLFGSLPFGAVLCFAIRIVLLGASFLCLRMMQIQTEKLPEPAPVHVKPHGKELAPYVWRPASAIAVAWFVIGIAAGNETAYRSPTGLLAVTLGSAALALIIGLISWKRGETPGYLSVIYSASSAFGIVLLLVSLTAQSSPLGYFWVVQFAASPLFDIVLLGTLVSARTVFKIRTHRLVCGVLCVKELFYLLGNLLQQPMGGHGDSLGVILLIAYLLVLFVGSAFDSFRSSSSPSIPEELSVAMSRKYALTPREVDVLRYLLQGSTYDRIGKQLFIAASTVKTHVNHIYAKMGVENRDEFIDLMNAGATTEPPELAARKL